MRIYVAIVVVAIAALCGIIAIGMKVFPGFLLSADLGKSLFVEAISFVFTTAVIGSLSAAVIRYLEKRKATPLLAYATQKIENRLSYAMIAYVELLALGRRPERNHRFSIATHGIALPRYYLHANESLRCYYATVNGWEETIEHVKRYIGAFPIEDQDDLHVIIDILEDKIADLDDFAEVLGAQRRRGDITLSEQDPELWRLMLNAVENALKTKFRSAKEKLNDNVRSDEIIRRSLHLLLEERNLLWTSVINGVGYHNGVMDEKRKSAFQISDVLANPEYQWDFDEEVSDEEAGLLMRFDPGEFGLGEGIYDLRNLVDQVEPYTFEKILERTGLTRAELFGSTMGYDALQRIGL